MKTKNPVGLDLAYGAKIGDFRGEFEIGYRADAKEKNPGSNADKISNVSYMVNGYYDIATGSKFTPYVGLGIGADTLKFKGDNTESSTSFAWQVGAGVSYAASDVLAIDFGYRYFDHGDVKWSESEANNPAPGYTELESTKIEVKSSEIAIGARYAF
jgi:opacity protein-like surface antigen